MSGMQPTQDPFDQSPPAAKQPEQFFPPYQAPEGQPQPYMGKPDPGLPNPQQQAATTYRSMATQPARKPSRLPLILMIVFIMLTVIATGFGLWAFAERQDYKNNSDQKAAAAAEAATKAEAARKDAEFIDKEKQPYKTYTTPDTSGAIKVQYPKTWSAYINEDDKAVPVTGYWHPAVVPGFQSGTAYALRVQVSNKPYVEEMKVYDSLVKSGAVKVSPYAPKNVAGVTGSRIEGEINKGQKNTMVVLPLRDKTIRLWTESPDFVNDFDGVVLENLTFTP